MNKNTIREGKYILSNGTQVSYRIAYKGLEDEDLRVACTVWLPATKSGYLIPDLVIRGASILGRTLDSSWGDLVEGTQEVVRVYDYYMDPHMGYKKALKEAEGYVLSDLKYVDMLLKVIKSLGK
jgi:hypothetical protein